MKTKSVVGLVNEKGEILLQEVGHDQDGEFNLVLWDNAKSAKQHLRDFWKPADGYQLVNVHLVVGEPIEDDDEEADEEADESKASQLAVLERQVISDFGQDVADQLLKLAKQLTSNQNLPHESYGIVTLHET